MKVYAIYQKGLGKIAREYIDTRDGLIAGRYMYIPENTLPVVIGRFGDYCTFVDEAEKKKGFVGFKTCREDEAPLSREEMYPKNAEAFAMGWISPEGDTYACGYAAHIYCADAICRDQGYDCRNGQRTLEKLGWAEITKNLHEKGAPMVHVGGGEGTLTEAQIACLEKLGIDGYPEIRMQIEYQVSVLFRLFTI